MKFHLEINEHVKNIYKSVKVETSDNVKTEQENNKLAMQLVKLILTKNIILII